MLFNNQIGVFMDCDCDWGGIDRGSVLLALKKFMWLFVISRDLACLLSTEHTFNFTFTQCDR